MSRCILRGRRRSGGRERPAPRHRLAAATRAASRPPPRSSGRSFRGGTHFVRVDAYPLEDGRIVEGLEAEDFEILEDGKPQQIDSFDFISFDSFTPDAERRDPVSQQGRSSGTPWAA